MWRQKYCSTLEKTVYINMTETDLTQIVREAIEDLKGIDVYEIDIREMSSIADYMMIATGTSNTHVKALSRSVVDKAKENSIRPLSTEGNEAADWVLVDFGDLIVHLMLPETREFYDLERLWSMSPQSYEETRREDSQSEDG